MSKINTTMSKKATHTSDSGKPAFMEELLKNGTTVLEAPTTESLAEMLNDIPADTKYSVGAVGRKADGSAYTLRLDII